MRRLGRVRMRRRVGGRRVKEVRVEGKEKQVSEFLGRSDRTKMN